MAQRRAHGLLRALTRCAARARPSLAPQFLRIVRLVRLTKLLRIIRMARLFTRFEEQMNVRSGCAPHAHALLLLIS
jgi:hypothetical protein